MEKRVSVRTDSPTGQSVGSVHSAISSDSPHDRYQCHHVFLSTPACKVTPHTLHLVEILPGISLAVVCEVSQKFCCAVGTLKACRTCLPSPVLILVGCGLRGFGHFQSCFFAGPQSQAGFNTVHDNSHFVGDLVRQSQAAWHSESNRGNSRQSREKDA